MRTNIELDDQLMQESMRASGTSTKRAAVEAALHLLVRTNAQGGIRALRGTVAWEGDLDQLRRNRVRDVEADAGR